MLNCISLQVILNCCETHYYICILNELQALIPHWSPTYTPTALSKDENYSHDTSVVNPFNIPVKWMVEHKLPYLKWISFAAKL
jgi:hypothetical protein